MQNLAIGVDIGGTKILSALVGPEGEVLRRWRSPTEASRGGPAVMVAVRSALLEALGSLTPDEKARVVGVGVSAAGQVDWRRGAIAYASPNIPGWTGTPIKQLLEAALDLPVVVDNDANAAAYGEWWAGAGRGRGDMVMLTVGTGIGGGVVLGGEVLRGGRFRGGEVGHMILVADGLPCNCGQTGCLEMYASGTAISRLAEARWPGESANAHELFAAADGGDPASDLLLTFAIRAMACGIISLSSILDPDLFLIGGGVASQPSYLYRLKAVLQESEVSGQRGFDVGQVVSASLGEDAGAVGAAGLLFAFLAGRSAAGERR